MNFDQERKALKIRSTMIRCAERLRTMSRGIKEHSKFWIPINEEARGVIFRSHENNEMAETMEEYLKTMKEK